MMQQRKRVLPVKYRARTRAVASTAGLALVAGTLGWVAFGAANAAPGETETDPDTGWSYTKESLASGQGFGFQLALDPSQRKVYLTDMKARSDSLDPATGQITTNQTGYGSTSGEPSGQLVVFNSETRQQLGSHDYNVLSRVDGSGPNSESPEESFFGAANATTGLRSYSSLRTDSAPYGVAIDSTTTNSSGAVDPTIITTTARQRLTNAPVLNDDGTPKLDGNGDPVTQSYGGGLVIYPASQGGPTDADIINAFDDGTPVLAGPRRIAVNENTHKAYVTSLGTQRGNGPNPGFITEVDLLTKQVTARVAIPDEVNGDTTIEPGTVGVAVDPVNDIVYAGTMAGSGLYAIDASALDRSNPKNLLLNENAVTKLGATLTGNQRPTYSAAEKRLYISQYDTKKLTVVDADPASNNYGEVVHEFDNLDTNAAEVDGERGLLFSANLKDFNVTVYDTTTFERVLTLPTSGHALNIGIDPETRDVWVSNWGGAASGWSSERPPAVDVFTLTEPEDEGPTEPELVEYWKSDGAVYWVPKTWTEGQPLTIRGEGWLTTPKGNTPPYPADYERSGSGVAAKIRTVGGAWIEPNETVTVEAPLVEPGGIDEVWSVFEANTDGTFEITLPYPGSEVTSNGAQVGDDIEIGLLTGSVKMFDTPRGAPSGAAPLGSPVVKVVAAGSGPVDPDPEDPEEPETPELKGDVKVTFGVDSADGGLSLAVASNVVDLGKATLNSSIDRLTATGTLPNVTVTDTRAVDLPWAVSGAASGFATNDGTEAAGASLGWAPKVVSATTGQVVQAGPTVAAADGFTGGSTLASALAGQARGTAVTSADLNLEALTSTPAGSYSGTITLTLS